MRRPKEKIKKLRKKVVEMRAQGATYEEIRRKCGVSPSTISKWVKGRDLKKYCKICGETDPLKLEEHHPDKINRPDYTITLCANCHSKLHRELSKKAKKIKNQRNISQQNSSTQIFSNTSGQLQTSTISADTYKTLNVSSPYIQIDPQIVEKAIKLSLITTGGWLIGKALWEDSNENPFIRLLTGGFGLFLLWLSFKS